MTAEIIPLVRLPKFLSYFDYEVPQNLEGQIKFGQLVKIPFKGRHVKGLIIKVKQEPKIKKGLKQIIKILDLEPQINSTHLKLIWWLVNYCSVSPALVAKTFIPDIPESSFYTLKIKDTLHPASLSIPKSELSAIQSDLETFFKSQKKYFLLHYQNQKYKIAFYLKVTEWYLKHNKQILILEPQISDINLILPYFFYLYPNQIAFLHSKLSKTEYWHEWKKIQKGEAKIVIGTRSALFAPFNNLGLIVVDDEEMPDFKQSDQSPRYDVRTAAQKLAKITKTKVLLGSQAPRVQTYYGVKAKRYELLANSLKVPIQKPVLIDMAQEIKKKNYLSLSDELQKNIRKILEKRQKVVLLLNRRGASTLVLCHDCGHIFKCASCDLPLIFHEESRLVCHHCGHNELVPLICPNCRGTSIKFFGTGTQRVEREIKKLFPQAKISRIDKDIKIQNIKYEIQNTEIFIGTQFFIKNYSPMLQNVGLIGIISADTLFFRPDFRSGEKTYQWLVKIKNISRQFKSLILIQTFFPNNFVIQSVIEQDYELFYKHEIEERKKFRYPPFVRLVKLTYQHKDEKKCSFEASKLFSDLVSSFGGKIEILKDEKPKKFKQKFILMIIIKFPISLTRKMINYFKIIPDGWAIDMEPESLL